MWKALLCFNWWLTYFAGHATKILQKFLTIFTKLRMNFLCCYSWKFFWKNRFQINIAFLFNVIRVLVMRLKENFSTEVKQVRWVKIFLSFPKRVWNFRDGTQAVSGWRLTFSGISSQKLRNWKRFFLGGGRECATSFYMSVNSIFSNFNKQPLLTKIFVEKQTRPIMTNFCFEIN